MAEVVQRNIEGMILELQHLERVKLFTAHETKQILRKRKAFEYKLQRKVKNKEDFLNYIKYEVNVLALIKKRRIMTGYSFKKEDIELSIVHRVHRMFKVATNRFRSDIKLWLSHIEFCQQWNQRAYLSRLFTAMLQIHDKKPELWMLAAKWEFEDNGNPDNARSLLQRGLRFNPTAKDLWVEYYRMELLYAEKLRRRKEILNKKESDDLHEEAPDAVLQGMVADIIYKKALEAFPGDVDFMLSFLPVCKLFDFAQNHVEQIFTDLQSMYADHPKTWNAMAWRHLNKDNAKNSNSEVQKFYEVFDEAVTKVSGDEIWSFYINGCLQILEFECDDCFKIQRIQKTLDVFENASDLGTLSENLFIQWLELLSNVGLADKIEEVSEKAVTQHSKSVSLWKHQLEMMIMNSGPENELLALFDKACHNLQEKETGPLWQLLMEYCISHDLVRTESLFKRGLSCVAVVANPLKELYMQWTFFTQGIKKTREVYKQLLQTRPVPLQMIRYYIEMEKSQPNPKINLLRQAHEDMIQEFGTVDTDVWLDAIKFELTQSEGQPERIGNLHFRAVKNLEGELNQQFISQYVLLQTGDMDL